MSLGRPSQADLDQTPSLAPVERPVTCDAEDVRSLSQLHQDLLFVDMPNGHQTNFVFPPSAEERSASVVPHSLLARRLDFIEIFIKLELRPSSYIPQALTRVWSAGIISKMCQFIHHRVSLSPEGANFISSSNFFSSWSRPGTANLGRHD